MTLEELNVVIKTEISGFQKGLATVKKDVENLNRSVNRELGKMNTSFSKALGGLKKMLIALGIGKIIRDSVRTGMEAIENENLFNVTFGDKYADEVRKWSEGVRKELGTNAFLMRKNAGMIFTFARNLGVSGGAAKDMSMNLSMLVEDMASFYNFSTEEMFTKIMSGMAGRLLPLILAII